MENGSVSRIHKLGLQPAQGNLGMTPAVLDSHFLPTPPKTLYLGIRWVSPHTYPRLRIEGTLEILHLKLPILFCTCFRAVASTLCGRYDKLAQ